MKNKQPPNPQDRLFISLSMCGVRDREPLVCCRDAPTAPPTPSPVAPPPQTPGNPLLPKPGVCGEDTENRIYGGNQVRKIYFNFFFFLISQLVRISYL